MGQKSRWNGAIHHYPSKHINSSPAKSKGTFQDCIVANDKRRFHFHICGEHALRQSDNFDTYPPAFYTCSQSLYAYLF